MATEMNVDYSAHPIKSLEQLMDELFRHDIIIEDIAVNLKTYTKKYIDVLDFCKYTFELNDENGNPYRMKHAIFRFNHEDRKAHSIEIRHLQYNLIMWYPFVVTDNIDVLDESYIFNPTASNFNVELENYINDRIIPNMNDVDHSTQNAIIDEIVHHITAISNAFTPLMGSSISLYSIHEAEKSCPEIADIMRRPIDPKMQPAEIEKELSRRTDRMMQLLAEDACDNDLRPLILAGNNISKGQFKELVVKIGLKSDINGNTIPHLIDGNFLIDGAKNPSDYYIIALSGRKALIFAKTRMGEPGAFSKKATSNTTAAKLSKRYVMCHSIRPIWYNIEDETFLTLLKGRYYYDDTGNLHVLDPEKDKDLIGKNVAFRSPVTCSSEDGICPYCYGKLYELNKNLASAGAYAATKITEPLGQMVLGTKHLQVTQTNHISFNEEFDDVFEINSNEITLKDDPTYDEDLSVVLHDVYEEESEDTVDYYCASFDVFGNNGRYIMTITEDHDARLYLSKQIADIWKKLKDKSKPISLSIFDDDSSVMFNVEVKSKETTQPTKNIKALLDTNDKCGCKTIDELCQALARNLINCGIKYDLVHAEMVVRQLVRKKSNVLESPDWTLNGDPDDYVILRLVDALIKNPSPLVSICSGYLKRQLLGPDLYKKTGVSHLDALFAEQLSQYLKPNKAYVAYRNVSPISK